MAEHLPGAVMTAYEYTVIPAPAKGLKAKGVKTAEARFAFALQELMNQMGAEGWEYQRAETLPSTERSGLTGSTTNWRHVLVFRRAREEVNAAAPALPELKVDAAAPPVSAPAVAAPVAAVAATAAAAEPVVEAVAETVDAAAETVTEPATAQEVETTVVREFDTDETVEFRRDPPLTSS